VTSLLNTDGDAVSSATLAPAGSTTLSSSPEPDSDRYFVELTTDCTPTSGPDVSYRASVTAGGGGRAPMPASASATPGDSIGTVGTPLQGDSYYTGKLTDATSDDWYVLYKTTGPAGATVRIQNTTPRATGPGCTTLTVQLTNTDGDTVNSATLGENMATTFSAAPGGRYFIELTDDNCNPGVGAPVTYSVEPEPAAQWGNPTPEPTQTLQGGVSKSQAAPLKAGIDYDGTIAGAKQDEWFSGRAGTGQSSWLIENAVLLDENCETITVTVYNASGDVIDSATLGRDEAVQFNVSIAGTYQLELTDDNCDPDEGTGLKDPPPFRLSEESTGRPPTTTTTTAKASSTSTTSPKRPPTTHPRSTTTTTRPRARSSTTTTRPRSSTTTTRPRSSTTTTRPGTTTTTRPRTSSQPTYVALGDSYSSGDGAITKSQTSYSNACHRTPKSYPYLLGVPVDDRACSAATIASMSTSFRGEPSQLSGLTAKTKTVTLTIGGNDIGLFALQDCMTSALYKLLQKNGLVTVVLQAVQGCEGRYGRQVSSDLESLPGKLATLYETIHARAPKARLLVLQYPNAFPASHMAACPSEYGQAFASVGGISVPLALAVGISQRDFPFLHSTIEKLDAAIARAGSTADRAGADVTVISPDVPDSFANHTICNFDAWFWGLRAEPIEATLHPNISGNLALAAAVKRYMK
jgi:hypothetical protein